MKYTRIKKQWLGLLANVYRLDQDVQVQTRMLWYFVQEGAFSRGYYRLNRNGLLLIKKGFVWDGPSGPTYDSPDSMRASLVHDVFYDMIRKGRLPKGARKLADQELRRIAIADGMWHWRANLWYQMVRHFGAGSAR